MSFQTELNRELPRAVAGDFASTNPRYSMLAGEGALVSGADITVGNFAFADLDTGIVHAEFAAGRRVGFVFRNNQAIVNPGQQASMILPQGREVSLITSGDVFTVFDEDVEIGQPVFASTDDGSPTIEEEVGEVENQSTRFVVAENRAAGELVRITVSAI